MNPPATVSTAARKRVREASDEIEHSLRAISAGRPGDAEMDESRRAAVVQVRNKLSLTEAAQLAPMTGPERIWGDTIDFVDVSFFERGLIAARAVCRIITKSGQGIGTGFLISENLLVTNNHVIASKSAATNMLAEFDYELDLGGMPRPVTRFALAPERLFLTNGEDDLDYTAVALAGRVSGGRQIADFGALPLSASQNKHALGDIVNIIQHPDGRMKEAVVRENQIVSRPKSGTVIHYVADTEPGSSGSPVFNIRWEVIALHHWGGPHRELVNEKGVHVPRTVNEGIRASAIVADLTTRKSSLNAAGRALIEEALTIGLESATPKRSVALDLRHAAAGNGDLSDRDGSLSISPEGIATWSIPLTVSVRLGGLGAQQREQPLVTGAATDRSTDAGGEARLELDENYGNRRGYNPDFLRSTTIPLPTLTSGQKRLAAKNQDRGESDDPFELKYQHFSVVMNGKRRLAFFTATNIDGSKAKDLNRKTGVISDASDDDENGSEATERWFEDPRINENEQTPSGFYSGQTTFDAAGNPITNKQTDAHRNRMFQQGHLTRRQDPLWGPDDDVIRAHADTFHVTNRAPQVGFFNMGTFKPASEAKGHAGGILHWRALEDFVLNNARADKKRVTVLTGPVFNDESDWPWARDDASMEGFLVPRAFWKLILRDEEGVLQATALLADQSPLIDHLPELREVSLSEAKRISFERVRRYHLSVAALEKGTGLDFGDSVRRADTFRKRSGEKPIREVKTLKDVIGMKSMGKTALKKSATKKVVSARKTKKSGRVSQRRPGAK